MHHPVVPTAVGDDAQPKRAENHGDAHSVRSPVDVVELVNGVDGQHHLSQVEPGHLLRQPVLELTEQSQQIPAHVVVHDQVLETPGESRQGDS